MKFTNFVLDLNGVPITQGGKEITIGECCIVALLANFEDERNLDGVEKLRRFKLADKISDAIHSLPGKADLIAEEIALIKKLVSKMFGPLVVGRVYAEIDPASFEGQSQPRERTKERKNHE